MTLGTNPTVCGFVQNARVSRLIETVSSEHGLNALDLYLLAMSIALHDVGNIHGRKSHERKLDQIYDHVRGASGALRREKTLVLRIIAAHTGHGRDGSADTLQDLENEDHLEERTVHPRDIAAVLRFADELAEGPQRTSNYRIHNGLIANASLPYHEYSNMPHIGIDRRLGRIALTYEVDVPKCSAADVSEKRAKLAAMLDFVFGRIGKLDQERRYARYYSSSLMPFKSTTVSLNFHRDGWLVPIDVPRVHLDDKVVPGSPMPSVCDLHPQLNAVQLADQLVFVSDL